MKRNVAVELVACLAELHFDKLAEHADQESCLGLCIADDIVEGLLCVVFGVVERVEEPVADAVPEALDEHRNPVLILSY